MCAVDLSGTCHCTEHCSIVQYSESTHTMLVDVPEACPVMQAVAQGNTQCAMDKLQVVAFHVRECSISHMPLLATHEEVCTAQTELMYPH